jgi:hypothetical protein
MYYFKTTFHLAINGSEMQQKILHVRSKSEQPSPNVLKDKITSHYRKEYPFPGNSVAVIIISTPKISESEFNSKPGSFIEM